MNIKILVTNDCPACARVIKALNTVIDEDLTLHLVITNIEEDKTFVTPIVPALFVNGKLFCYGDVDKHKLLKFVAEEKTAV